MNPGASWALWGGTTLAGFLALEITGIVKGGTLTQTFRRALGLDPWKWYGALTRLGLIGFCAWLAIHLGWGVLPT